QAGSAAAGRRPLAAAWVPNPRAAAPRRPARRRRHPDGPARARARALGRRRADRSDEGGRGGCALAGAAVAGPIVLMKGPEVAALWPTPQSRPYSDVDLLVEDAAEAQRALLAAGLRPVGDPGLYVDIHHLRPLLAPGLAVAVEVHDRPKWIDGLGAPPTVGLLAAAVPST